MEALYLLADSVPECVLACTVIKYRQTLVMRACLVYPAPWHHHAIQLPGLPDVDALHKHATQEQSSTPKATDMSSLHVARHACMCAVCTSVENLLQWFMQAFELGTIGTHSHCVMQGRVVSVFM